MAPPAVPAQAGESWGTTETEEELLATAHLPRPLKERVTQTQLRVWVCVCGGCMLLCPLLAAYGEKAFWGVTEGTHPCGTDPRTLLNPPQWTPPTALQWAGLQATLYLPFVGLLASLVGVRLTMCLKIQPAMKAAVLLCVAVFYAWLYAALIMMSADDFVWSGGSTCSGLSVAYVLTTGPVVAGVAGSMLWTAKRIFAKYRAARAAGAGGSKPSGERVRLLAGDSGTEVVSSTYATATATSNGSRAPQTPPRTTTPAAATASAPPRAVMGTGVRAGAAMDAEPPGPSNARDEQEHQHHVVSWGPAAAAKAGASSAALKKFVAPDRLHLLAVVLCVGYIPLMVLLTAALPNSFSNFPNWAAARNPARTHDGPETGVYNVYLFTLLDHTGKPTPFHLKFYATVLVYYGVLWAMTLLGLLAAASPRVHRLLHYRVAVAGWHTWTCSVGEMCVAVGFLAITVFFACFWLNREYEPQYPHQVDNRHSGVVWARSFGQMAALFMGFLTLPLPRSFGFWSTGLGVSWEAGMAVHRWCGYAVFAASFLHQMCWWTEWSADIKYVTNITSLDAPPRTGMATFYRASLREYFTLDRRYHSDDYTITTITAAWWVAVFSLFCLAYERVRRERFEMFKYAHHFGMIFLFIAMLHGHSVWYYSVGGVSLWLVDRLIRFNRGAIPVDVVHADVYTDITRLVIKRPVGFRFKAGQYAFLNAPHIAPLSWHPFSISSTPMDDELLTFHIKSMGDDQWTGQLHYLAGHAGRAALTVFMDGPYGLPPDFSKYDHVLFIAGGIGVTPARSILHTLADVGAPYSASLVWIVSSVVDRTYMDEALAAVRRSKHDVDYKIFVRGASHSFIALPKRLVPVAHRDGVVALVRDELRATAARCASPERVLVHLSGPRGLQDAVRPDVLAQRFHCHTETFEI